MAPCCSPAPRLLNPRHRVSVLVLPSMAAGGPATHGHPRTAGWQRSAGDDVRAQQARKRNGCFLGLAIPVDRTASANRLWSQRIATTCCRCSRQRSMGIAPDVPAMAARNSQVRLLQYVDAPGQRIDPVAATSPDVVGEVFYVNHSEIVTVANTMRAIATELGRSVLPVPIPQMGGSRGAPSTVTSAWARFRAHLRCSTRTRFTSFSRRPGTADPGAFIREAAGWQPRWNLHRRASRRHGGAWYREHRRIWTWRNAICHNRQNERGDSCESPSLSGGTSGLLLNSQLRPSHSPIARWGMQ